MERLLIQEGRVVRSTQGRDEGRYFVVLQVLDGQYALMADGRTRKLDHLKKKKATHLRPMPVIMEELNELREHNTLQDASIRRFLEEHGYGPDKVTGQDQGRSQSKEDGSLV